MRKAIAAAMSRSKREIPHYYLASDVDVTDAVKWLGKVLLMGGDAERALGESPVPVLLVRHERSRLRKVNTP